MCCCAFALAAHCTCLFIFYYLPPFCSSCPMFLPSCLQNITLTEPFSLLLFECIQNKYCLRSRLLSFSPKLLHVLYMYHTMFWTLSFLLMCLLSQIYCLYCGFLKKGRKNAYVHILMSFFNFIKTVGLSWHLCYIQNANSYSLACNTGWLNQPVQLGSQKNRILHEKPWHCELSKGNST